MKAADLCLRLNTAYKLSVGIADASEPADATLCVDSVSIWQLFNNFLMHYTQQAYLALWSNQVGTFGPNLFKQ